MQTVKLTSKVMLGTLVLGLCLVIGYQASAMRQMMARPVSIAFVDLEKVFENLKERGDEDVRLGALADERDKENKQYADELNEMKSNLELFVPGSDEYENAERDYIKKSLEYDAWKKFTVSEIDREKALILQKLYKNVKKEVAAVAEGEGYDVVLLNDSIKELQSGTEQQVTLQISARRVLYATPSIDITDHVIDKMNNAYQQAQGG